MERHLSQLPFWGTVEEHYYHQGHYFQGTMWLVPLILQDPSNADNKDGATIV